MQHGFTILAEPQRTELWLHRPPVSGTPLLSCARTGAQAAMLLGRLHYQDELRTRLGRGHHCCDAALALAAFQRWGREALGQLDGDFAIVFWDGASSSLVAGRDLQGGYPLFWTRHGERWAFSTNLFTLVELRGDGELNQEYLADFLTLTDPRNEVPGESSAYRGIQRVLPGNIVHVSLRTGRLEKRAYWNWLDHVVEPETDRLEEVAPRFRAVLQAAVGERLHGRAAAHFSGGMDATSVALLAREVLVTTGSNEPLHTLSVVYERLPKLARERHYLEAAQACAVGCIPHCLPGDDLLDFDAFVAPPAHEEPFAGLWRMAMDGGLLRAAAEVGAQAVLTGCGADELVDAKPYGLADLVHRGRLIAAWREATRWALARHGNAWSMLGPFGLAGFRAHLPPWLGGTGGWGKGPLGRQTEHVIPAWIRPFFARATGFCDRMRAAARKRSGPAGGRPFSTSVAALMARAGDVVRWSVAEPLGIVYSHPFQDRRVQAVALGVLKRIPPQPTPMKPLLALALGGLLPPELTQRRAKGHFDEVYYRGLRRNLRLLGTMVRESPLVRMDIVDSGLLRQALGEASLGGRHGRHLHSLSLALCLACWLANEGRWRHQHLRPTEHIILGQYSAPGQSDAMPLLCTTAL